jgi:RHS repeat-associated protein
LLPVCARQILGLLGISVALASGLPPPVDAADVVEYVVTDAIGNIRVVTDEQGKVVERHDYLPFGEEWTTGPCAANPGVAEGQTRKFTGKERDEETGLDYFGARYYSAPTARFTTVDPVLDQKAALVDPQQWNRYAYARNNPLKFTDPDGRHPVLIVLALAAAFVLNNPTNTNITQGPVNDTIVPNSLIVAAGYGFAAGGLRTAGKEVLEETIENVTGLPVGGLPTKPTRGGETRFTAAGRRAHAEEPLPTGFERDVRLPSGKRMDGYNAAEKQVLELKPDNQRAVRRGERQVGGYCSECDQTYGAGHSGRVQAYDQKKYLEKEKN